MAPSLTGARCCAEWGEGASNARGKELHTPCPHSAGHQRCGAVAHTAAQVASLLQARVACTDVEGCRTAESVHQVLGIKND